MRKSIIAATVITLISGSAMAATAPFNVNDAMSDFEKSFEAKIAKQIEANSPTKAQAVKSIDSLAQKRVDDAMNNEFAKKLQFQMDVKEATAQRTKAVDERQADVEKAIVKRTQEVDAGFNKVGERMASTEKAIIQRTKDVDAGFNKVGERIDSVQAASNRRDSFQDSAIASNKAAIADNKSAIIDLRKDLERQSEEMSGGIASVAAMANIPHMQAAGQFSVGAGIGHYNGESAVAVGVGYRVNESVTTQFGIAANTGNDIEPVMGAGVAYAF